MGSRFWRGCALVVGVAIFHAPHALSAEKACPKPATIPDSKLLENMGEARGECESSRQKSWTERLADEDFSECLVKVCGDPAGMLNVTNYEPQVRDAAAALDDEVQKRLGPIVRRWAEAEREYALREIDYNLAALERHGAPKTVATKRALGAMVFQNLFGQIETTTDQGPKTLAPVNKSLSEAFLAIIDHEKMRKILKKEGLSETETKLFYEQSAKLFETISKDLAKPGQEESALIAKFERPLRDAVVSEFEEVKKTHESLFKSLEKDIGIRVPKHVREDENRNVDAMLEFVRTSSGLPLALVRVSLQQAYLGKVFKDLTERVKTPDPLTEKFSRRDWGGMLPKIKAELTGRRAKLESPKFKAGLSRGVDSCIADISLAAASYPTKARRGEMLAELKRTMAEMPSRFEGILSKSTGAAWKENSSRIDLVAPPSREDWMAFAEVYFNRKAVERERDDFAESQAGEKALPDFVWWQVADVLFSENKGEKKYDTVQRNIQNSCQFFQIEEAFRDYNLTRANTIVVSSASFSNADVGAGTVAHEMGHSLNEIFRSGKASKHSSKWYATQRSCIARWHPEAGEWPVAVPGGMAGLPYFEEDFADAMAAKADRRALSMACALSTSGSHIYYDDNADGDIGVPSLLNRDDTDTHSSYTFRILHTYWALNHSLPAECRASLKRSGLPETFNDCM